MKVLIVDDSEAVRVQLKAALVQAAFDIVEAADGNEGLAKILATPDLALVITDYNMPGMDGIAMLQKVKEKYGTFPFPVLILTTETSTTLKQQGKVLGVTAWINKPFPGPKLVEAVKKVTAAKKVA